MHFVFLSPGIFYFTQVKINFLKDSRFLSFAGTPTHASSMSEVYFAQFTFWKFHCAGLVGRDINANGDEV